jgi:hypothetical protein
MSHFMFGAGLKMSVYGSRRWVNAQAEIEALCQMKGYTIGSSTRSSQMHVGMWATSTSTLVWFEAICDLI